eukprot:CAMPEP_0116877216 /NCGR_PEP_ID=MMETSP0463-20121206/9023_1 /TAXON_ID=181622 /ORGANISM="Strombidinopsis sp, Strain SopsisLIS2011" /LENGTH=71 /DNA_ID=CAMNT_0004524329 /DNA_START=16 /DNA_END=231 /DNA_ORIENTATION=+
MNEIELEEMDGNNSRNNQSQSGRRTNTGNDGLIQYYDQELNDQENLKKRMLPRKDQYGIQNNYDDLETNND